MIRKCSMCGAYKEEAEYRFMNKQNRYNSYCKECERFYQKHYMRIYRERQRNEFRWN